MPYAAYLRIYQPVGSFPPAERAMWSSYVAIGAASDVSSGAEVEHRAALAALAGPVPAIPQTGEQAFVADWDGVVCVCPWRTEQRAQTDLIVFRRGLPDQVAAAFVPDAIAVGAERDVAEWRGRHPEQRLHIRTSPWLVPPHWFLLFDPDDRAGWAGSGSAAATALVYRTGMRAALARIEHARAVVSEALGVGPLAAGIDELADWLAGFPEGSFVELDYAGLASLFDPADPIDEDETVADVTTALARLADGDLPGAATVYRRVTTRWRPIQAREAAN